ncbi:MAG: T9SS type A sorting domain-containing protein [Chitinophagales bacterium]|nr:T9SS type A sorting domain-containing protein [Chitinophagaceae bacterium]MCB9066168.1 T9SS type A sorting domain-containing protein [Chitinophagales bacterium]
MTKTTTQFRLVLLQAVAVLLFFNTASAATYTAVTSGNYNAASTWQGGLVPPTSVSGDNIVIPTGIGVQLNQNVELKSGASLTVIGSLVSTTGNSLSIVNSSLTGTGNITVDSFAANFTTGFTYTGTLTTKIFNSSNAVIGAASNIFISEKLYLRGGTMAINAGSVTLTGTNNTIIVEGGSVTVSGASLSLTTDYNVIYQNANATTGLELSGSGLKNIDVNVGGGKTVSLGADLVVNGTLNLTSGTLSLNNNNLTFNATGNLGAGGGGVFYSTSGSDITVNSTTGLSDNLRFTTGGNTVDDFTINLGDSTAKVGIESETNVSGTLSLQSGRVDVDNNKLALQPGAMVSGGSAKSYVITSGGGSLAMQVTGGSAETFHVGTNNRYTPATVNSVSGSVNSVFGVSAFGDVKAVGSTGETVAATQPVVSNTWMIAPNTATGVTADIELYWHADMEVNSFNRAMAYISHYTGGNWDTYGAAAATVASNGMYKISRMGLTSFSPFAVFDQNTKVSVNNITADKGVDIYPNPASNTLYIRNASNATAEIVNIAGKKVLSTEVSNNTGIDISTLSNGLYFIRLSGDDVKATFKFIKRQ